jgi:hypothetical protein
MVQDPAYDELIEPLAEVITRFLAGDFDYSEFRRQFQPVLESYEKSINDRAYWPLGVIADIPKHCKTNLHEWCHQALERLPKEALDRSTRCWLESTLIGNDDGYTYFSFFGNDGESRFGTHAAIYSTRIDRDSFLLSSLNGTIKRPRFQYPNLLTALRVIGGNELASWVYGTEPDNALAVIDRIWSLGDAYSESEQLRHIERQPAPEGGGSYLMLLPKSKQWMLMNEYDYERFTIYVHGRREFIADVASQLGVEPDWGWRPPNAA